MDSPDGTALLDGSPHPTAIPRQQPSRSPGVPLFSGSSPFPPEESRPAEESPDGGSASEADFPDESAPSPSTGTSSGTSATRVSNPLAGEGLKDMLRGAVLIGGDQAHNLLARTEGQQAVELYKADEDDAKAIGDPLARIAERREGLGEVSPDTADLLAAMVGLTRYATKQISRSRQAQALDAAGTVQQRPEAVDL
jgi:hypothetical protein